MKGHVRCVSSAVALLAVCLGCAETLLRWQFQAALADAPHLQEVDTIDEANITREFFYREYVSKRRPVKLRLADPEGWSQDDFMRRCNMQHRVHLMVHSTYSVYTVMNENWWLRMLFNWAMVLMGKWTTLEEEAKNKLNVTIGDYLADADEHPGGPGREYAVQVPILLRRILPDYVTMVMDTWSRPPYLGDKETRRVCQWLVEHYRIPKLISPTWLYWGNTGGIAKALLEQEPKFFMGKAHTKAFPLHLHMVTGYQEDFVMVTLQGRKRYALFHPREGENLGHLKVGKGTDVFMVDPFVPDLVGWPRYKDAVGWAGTIEAGEMLYVPGDWIHGMDNFDFTQLTVTMRFHMRSHAKACPQLASQPEAACAARLGVDLQRAQLEPPTIQEYLLEMERRIGIFR